MQSGLIEGVHTRDGVLGPQPEILQAHGFCQQIGDLVDGPHRIRVATLPMLQDRLESGMIPLA